MLVNLSRGYIIKTSPIVLFDNVVFTRTEIAKSFLKENDFYPMTLFPNKYKHIDKNIYATIVDENKGHIYLD